MEEIIKNENQKEKVSREVALSDVKKFVEAHDDLKKEEWQIEQDYPHVIQAIQWGLLSFSDSMIPIYRLKNPILNDEKEVAIDSIEFRTRIKPDDLSRIMKGLNIQQNQIEYTHRCLSYIIKQEKSMLSKFSKFDYKVLEQLTTVFL